MNKESKENISDVSTFFSGKRVFISIMIGLSIVGLLMWNKVNLDVLKQLEWTWHISFYLFLAVCMVVGRDLGYMLRLRILLDAKISWRKCFDVIMLWEFASAITPSIIGGSGIAIFIINKEKISFGKSTAVVMVTALMDELFYVITVPVVLLFTGLGSLFPKSFQTTILGANIGGPELFALGYVFILSLTGIIFYTIFIKAETLKIWLEKMGQWALFSRWNTSFIKTGKDLVITAKNIKGRSFLFWLKVFGATFISWTARFLVVNFMIQAFTNLTLSEHFVLYGKQLVMWVILLISPTPGGSGVAEFVFSEFLIDFIPLGFPVLLALLWRLLSYYPYLLVGSIVLPKWLKRVSN